MAGNSETDPTPAGRSALRVTGLSWAGATTAALEQVSFDVAAGEVITLVAPDRSAVAALLHLLSGIAVPGTGTIELDGVDVTAEPAYRRARRGLARGYPVRPLWADMTAEEQVRLAVQVAQETAWSPWRREPGHEAAVERLLDRAGLTDQAGAPSSLLSPGETRRLELAMLLADDPKIALLGEPLEGVPEAEAAEVTALIRALSDEDGRTVLMTAPPDSAGPLEALSDRVIVLPRQAAGCGARAGEGVATPASGPSPSARGLGN
ncbi:ATP-binding cassette domain-containing protein [Streptomyces caeni]|uniref:ATP-binding cassette domain-containing protein n=1 Tax=Streptomyces caeni TaxID=2307231 RepID=A0ABW4ITI7_9ACTN